MLTYALFAYTQMGILSVDANVCTCALCAPYANVGKCIAYMYVGVKGNKCDIFWSTYTWIVHSLEDGRKLVIKFRRWELWKNISNVCLPLLFVKKRWKEAHFLNPKQPHSKFNLKDNQTSFKIDFSFFLQKNKNKNKNKNKMSWQSMS